jgi:hypothetical protein
MNNMTNLNIGDTVYYRGIGYIHKTSIYRIFEENGIRKIETNCGVIRSISDLDDIYLTKEEANRSLSDSCRAGIIYD